MGTKSYFKTLELEIMPVFEEIPNGRSTRTRMCANCKEEYVKTLQEVDYTIPNTNLHFCSYNCRSRYKKAHPEVVKSLAERLADIDELERERKAIKNKRLYEINKKARERRKMEKQA